VDIDDLQSLTFLKTDPDGTGVFSTTWSATDYQLNPLNRLTGGITSPYTQIRAVGEYLVPIYEPRNVNSYVAIVQIQGVWGFATIPTAIRQATIILSMRQFKRYDSPTGVMGFGDLGVMRVGSVDPDIQALLMPFRRMFLA
jgi:hypothetical protein